MPPTLEDAIAAAVSGHRGQKDRGGQPYILHPLRVMLRQQDEAARIVAVLHDILEDTAVTLADLQQAGYSEAICRAIACLTHLPEESYEAMIERVAADPLARRVKLADLEDNMDPRRLLAVGDADLRRMAKYQAAWNRLTAAESGAAGSEPRP